VLNFWLPPLGWSLAVLLLSGDVGSAANTGVVLQWLLSWFVTPQPAQLTMVNFYFRKTGHFLVYGCMAILWFRAFRGQAGYGPWRACLWALGFCLGCALMDEGDQWFHPSRGASLYDVILDMSGAGLAALISGAFWTPGGKTVAASWTVGRETIGPE
jgi:VanZ family protein